MYSSHTIVGYDTIFSLHIYSCNVPKVNFTSVYWKGGITSYDCFLCWNMVPNILTLLIYGIHIVVAWSQYDACVTFVSIYTGK